MPLSWNILADLWVDGVKFNHHDEKNVLLEFNTSKWQVLVASTGLC